MASISITAPSSAEEGKRVSVYVNVTNTRTIGYIFKIEVFAVPDIYPHYFIFRTEEVILGGSSKGYSALFTMPDCNTTILVNVERWENDRWNYEGIQGKVVSLEIPAPETFHLSVLVPSWAAGGYVDPGSGDYPANTTIALRAYPLSGYRFTSWGRDASGTSTTFNLYMNSDKNVEAYFEKVPVPQYTGSISKKELEYDETRGTIPVSNVPQGKRGLVHVWGRNDMTTSQKLGISWVVKDPTGLTVESYSDWQSLSATPGGTHEFIGGRFDINKTGTWTIAIGLFMNPSAPVQVASYNGTLCTVPVPQYKGSIARKELEYDETRSIIPVY